MVCCRKVVCATDGVVRSSPEHRRLDWDARAIATVHRTIGVALVEPQTTVANLARHSFRGRTHLNWVTQMSRARTRVVVTMEGKVRELFSVIERPSGDLVLLDRPGLNFETKNELDTPIIDQKFSIHVSPLSPGTTIKFHMRLSNGSNHTTALFVHGPKNRLISHVFSRAWGDVSNEKWDHAPKNKDDVINIGNIPSTYTNFITSIFVMAKNITPYSIEHAPHFSINFSRFIIVIYTTFVNLPSPPAHQSIYSASSPLQINGIVSGSGPEEAGGVSPMALNSIRGYFDYCCFQLATDIIGWINARVGENIANGHKIWFTSRALEGNSDISGFERIESRYPAFSKPS